VEAQKRQTWILTGSPENFRASRERGFRVVGIKERRRRLAERMEPGDLVVFYLTGVQAFGAIARIAGGMYEDRSRIWPGKPGKADDYPWRFEAEPVLVLDEDRLLPAEDLAGGLEHVRKWPAEHWQLAFQGQLRPVSEADGELIERGMRERRCTRAAAGAGPA
jgi:EVE domain